MRLHALSARGSIRGELNVGGERQGEPGCDDYILRLGLVEVGTRRPGFFERRFAPVWIRTRFDSPRPERESRAFDSSSSALPKTKWDGVASIR